MKKNNKLYDAIGEALNRKTCRFNEVENTVKKRMGESYNERQLRNVLYRQVKIGCLGKNNNGEYYMTEIGYEEFGNNDFKRDDRESIFTNYIERIKMICLEEEKKLSNPFERFSEKEILDAKRVYELNKRILKLLK